MMTDDEFDKRIDAEDPPVAFWLQNEARRARESEKRLVEALKELVGWMAEARLEMAGHIGLDDARDAIERAQS
jgi:hypothetical protein